MSELQSLPEQGPDALRAVAMMFADLGERLAVVDADDVFSPATATVVARVPGADAASITTLRAGKFSTVGATDNRARRADALQYELGSGPCVDAILERTLYNPDDLRLDDRWPEYGQRVSEQLGWMSMLSFRLSNSLMTDDTIAGLNIYSQSPAAFDDNALRMGLLMATHGALAIAAATHRDRADNLARALRNSREIGVAIGVLMSTHQLTRDQAFDLLRIASQNTNRKLSEVAIEVGDTGTLDVDAATKPEPEHGGLAGADPA
jgi:hypothetical protein